MITQYNITSAEPAGGDPDKYGNVKFWLTIEHVGRALVGRRPDSPILNGLTWGEVEERTSKAGKPYKKFTVKQAPENVGGAAATTNGGTPPETRSPSAPSDRSHRIERQHSQEMAIRFLSMHPVRPGRDEVRNMTDWFQSDLDNKPALPAIVEEAKEMFNAKETPNSW
jgi:hypothetical protein